MKKVTYLLTGLCLTIMLGTNVNAQTNKPAPPETKQFDFWVGEWDAEWKTPNGTIAKGKNSLKYTLGGNVIEENFNGAPGNTLIGKSWSIYHAPTKRWHQTWVDNQGGLILFTGHVFEDGRRTFQTAVTNNSTSRMVFYDIKDNSFMWDWEASKDGGKTWTLQWRISYTRSDAQK